jgi:NAD(P)-dependent dehydrogenase (short-subunit alcohol dehydrogenase family)
VTPAVVFGGYGTFGTQVARELGRLGVPLVIAGRDLARAETLAGELGPPHRAVAADVGDPASCRTALQGQAVAVNCAGPFAGLGPALLQACLETGCHYADIAEDRGYAALVRGLDEQFRQRDLVAVYGCSSLPAISGALGLAAREGCSAIPERARVTLFIGNDNPKGAGAIAALIRVLGKPIGAPQGVVYGFRDREVVPLPQPFGPRAVFNFESPEYDLFPKLLGVTAVSVKVGFELRPANYAFAFLAALSLRYGPRTVRFLKRLGDFSRGIGCSGGAVMTELFFPDGGTRRATLLARADGQRMAALPCARAVHALCAGAHAAWGAMTAYEFLGAAALLGHLTEAGFELRVASRASGGTRGLFAGNMSLP